jgi:hypothetical protein
MAATRPKRQCLCLACRDDRTRYGIKTGLACASSRLVTLAHAVVKRKGLGCPQRVPLHR